MNKPRIIGALAATALLTLPLASIAAGGPMGKNEIMGSASYTDIEDTTLTNIDLAYGRYLTDVHEVGVRVGYLDVEFDGVAYQRFQGAEKWIDDADGVSVNVGLLMRF